MCSTSGLLAGAAFVESEKYRGNGKHLEDVLRIGDAVT